jgi:hypothetical protein
MLVLFAESQLRKRGVTTTRWIQELVIGKLRRAEYVSSERTTLRNVLSFYSAKASKDKVAKGSGAPENEGVNLRVFPSLAAKGMPCTSPLKQPLTLK